MSKYILGVDIGGTSVKIGIITNEGDIQHKWEIPTVKTNGETLFSLTFGVLLKQNCRIYI